MDWASEDNFWKILNIYRLCCQQKIPGGLQEHTNLINAFSSLIQNSVYLFQIYLINPLDITIHKGMEKDRKVVVLSMFLNRRHRIGILEVLQNKHRYWFHHINTDQYIKNIQRIPGKLWQVSCNTYTPDSDQTKTHSGNEKAHNTYNHKRPVKEKKRDCCTNVRSWSISFVPFSYFSINLPFLTPHQLWVFKVFRLWRWFNDWAPNLISLL